MEWKEWETIYKEIARDFGYNISRDEEAAKIALSLAVEKDMAEKEDLRRIIEDKVVVICGAAISKEMLSSIEGSIISADETTSFLLKHEILPHIITTDLDGNIHDIIKANDMGSIVIIHAHGDNVGKLKEFIPKFKGKIMISCQSKPFGKAYNFGGFTDGDRAYCIAKHFKAREIKLIGFDFENPKPKKGKNIGIKKRKLEWAKKIIQYYK